MEGDSYDVQDWCTRDKTRLMNPHIPVNPSVKIHREGIQWSLSARTRYSRRLDL
jgi:hypothetical protein